MKQKNYIEEYVSINGITQYFLHYPAESDVVALFLHGGPGQSEAHFAYLLAEYWDYCNMVYYDQRGAGKTQTKTKSKPGHISLENLIEDLRHTIQYIKAKYQTEKIFLVGHSWGSILGLKYVKQYPKDVLCYVGFGQVVDLLEGEKIGYAKLKETIQASGNKSDFKKLNRINLMNSDKKNFTKELLSLRKMQRKYGLMFRFRTVLSLANKSPVSEFSDLIVFLTAFKTNKNLMEYLLSFSILNVQEYDLPIYFILGRDDWQVPSVLAEKYLEQVTAPRKKIYWIENAGHLLDIDNPSAFNAALKEIICVEKEEIPLHYKTQEQPTEQ